MIRELFKRALAAVDAWATPEKRSGVANPDPWLTDLVRGPRTASGVYVTPDSALDDSAVWRAVNILSDTTAGLPVKVFRAGKDGEFPEEVREVPAFRLLRRRANPIMNALQFRRMLTRHLITWGNGYAEIERDGAARPAALWPMLPKYVTVEVTKSAQVFYNYRLPGLPAVRKKAEDVFHLSGLGDGIEGDSVIGHARESLGNGIAADRFAGLYFGQGMNVGAVLEHPGTLGEKAAKRLRESKEAIMGGLENAHRLAVLEEGMKLGRNDMPLEDAQLLETRRFSVEEVSRWFGVPQHMLSELSRATWANIESLAIEFVQYGLMPRLQTWEAEADEKLFSDKTPGRMFVKFVVEGLLRGDSASRAEFYSKALNNGWMSPNEIRRKEDMAPIGPDGDVYLVQGALVPLETIGDEPEPPPEPPPEPDEPEEDPDDDEPDEEEPEEDDRSRLAASHRGIFRDAADRMIRKEASAAKRNAKRDVSEFTEWVTRYYDDHESTVCGAVGPACDAFVALTGGSAVDWARSLAKTHADQSRNELLKVARAATDRTLPEMIGTLVTGWESRRADAFADAAIGANDG